MQFTVPERIRIVLVGTTHPGNIGAAARAMKTMTMNNLALVAPKQFPDAAATARAAGADDILARATRYNSLAEAVSDCVLVYGATARTRHLPCPVLTPREACAELFTQAGDKAGVAIVFGREQSGLSNRELDLCNKVILIPGNADFSSLNLAAAVQIICYELYQYVFARQLPATGSGQASEPVTAEALEQLYEHLEACLTETGFLDPDRPRQLMRRLRRLFNRAAPDQNEYNILRGILASVQSALRTRSGSG